MASKARLSISIFLFHFLKEKLFHENFHNFILRRASFLSLFCELFFLADQSKVGRNELSLERCLLKSYFHSRAKKTSLFSLSLNNANNFHNIFSFHGGVVTMARASRCGFKEFSFNKFSVHLIEHEFPCSRSTNLIVKRKIDVHRTFSCGFNLMSEFEYFLSYF